MKKSYEIIYKPHPFLKSWDHIAKKSVPVLVGNHGFIKIWNPIYKTHFAGAGFISRKSTYYRVSIPTQSGRKCLKYVHRLVAETHCKREAKCLRIVHHLNNNRRCNEAWNLEFTSVGLNCLMKKTSGLIKTVNENWTGDEIRFQACFQYRGVKIMSVQSFKTEAEAKQLGIQLRAQLYSAERARLIREEKEKAEEFGFISE